MKKLTSYVIYFKDRLNCSRIESARPGQDIPLLVVPEDAPEAQPLPAIGRLSSDKKIFTVVVKTPDGGATHEWNYEWLLEAIRECKPPV